ncbi:portal protein [Xanthomonas phage DES1]|nr:portal protein [Xanthomonas phage DES1]
MDEELIETPALAVVEVVDLTPEEMDEMEKEMIEEKRRKEELRASLANSVETKFQERARRRSTKESQWIRSSDLYYGKLSIDGTSHYQETPFQSTNKTRRPDINIVRAKCNVAVSQSVTTLFGTSNKNWDLDPAPNNNDPTMRERAEAMEAEVLAQQDKSKYVFEARKAIWDRVILGTGVMKGPVNTGEVVRSYEKMQDSSVWLPSVSVDYSPKVCRVNPWFFYPDETVDDVANLQDVIELHPMSALDLKKYIKHEGFEADAIREILEEHPKNYYEQNWNNFTTLIGNNPYIYDNKYMVLEYHGPITRKQLDELSVDTCTYEAINDEYYGEVWVCQGKVIRIALENIEASYRVPYFAAPWERDSSSVFGYGVPLMMEDAQRVVNESWHMILDNSSMSSGPQVAMQKGLIEPASGKFELGPGQMWYLTDPQATVDQAIQFFNVPNVTQNIVPILNMAMQFGEEESMIPLISAGLQSPDMADTATGSAMMMQASTTLLDFMSEEWNDLITLPTIEGYVAWNMQYNEKQEIKGNFVVDVRTSTEYKNKQVYMREMEKLSVEAAQNPELAKWINMDALTKARLASMTIPHKEIVKSEQQVAEEQAAMQPQPDIAMLELQLEERKQTLLEAELQFKMQQEQQREAWEHDERMAAAQARLVESEARVAVSQNEKEIEILKLAQRDQENSQAILSKMQMNRENNQTKTFQIAMQEARKQQETDTYRDEVSLAAKTGKGV